MYRTWDCLLPPPQIDQPGSAIDAYIVGLRDVLERKAANIVQLQGRLENFQARTTQPLSGALLIWKDTALALFLP